MPKRRFATMPTGQQVVATIAGKAGDSAGWGFVPKIRRRGARVTAKFSGSANAKWYLDFPGTGLKSGWQPAMRDATEVKFDIPAGQGTRTRVDLYVWTDDGQPAEIRLHAVAVDGEAQSLAGANTVRPSVTDCDARLDVARAVGTVSRRDGRKLTARVLANRNVAVFETADAVTLTPCAANFIPPSTRGTQRGVEWVLTKFPATRTGRACRSRWRMPQRIRVTRWRSSPRWRPRIRSPRP